MVVQALNPSTWKTESLYVYEFEASLFHIGRSSPAYSNVVTLVLETKQNKIKQDTQQGSSTRY